MLGWQWWWVYLHRDVDSFCKWTTNLGELKIYDGVQFFSVHHDDNDDDVIHITTTHAYYVIVKSNQNTTAKQRTDTRREMQM